MDTKKRTWSTFFIGLVLAMAAQVFTRIVYEATETQGLMVFLLVAIWWAVMTKESD